MVLTILRVIRGAVRFSLMLKHLGTLHGMAFNFKLLAIGLITHREPVGVAWRLIGVIIDQIWLSATYLAYLREGIATESFKVLEVLRLVEVEIGLLVG